MFTQTLGPKEEHDIIGVVVGALVAVLVVITFGVIIFIVVFKRYMLLYVKQKLLSQYCDGYPHRDCFMVATMM